MARTETVRTAVRDSRVPVPRAAQAAVPRDAAAVSLDSGPASARAAAAESDRDRSHPASISRESESTAARRLTNSRDTMTDLANKTGLIVGIANKRSISWAIAQAASAAGARLAVTYQGERLEENVRELSAGLTDPLVLPCDVTDDAQIAEVFAAIDREFGGLDFVVHGAAFAPREELASDFHFVDTTRAGFKLSMDVSAYSLIALARGAAPLMDRRGGGSILTLTYLGSERVFQNYNVMGVAKAALEACVRYLAADLGPRGIRVNAISAGPIKTLAASGISGFSTILQHYRDRAPLRRTVETAEVAEAAMFLLSPAGRAVTAEVLMVDGGFHATGM
jgi:enoyl-[acyl-carrier protein] reductase I